MGQRVFIALALVMRAVVPAHAQLPASMDERIQRDELVSQARLPGRASRYL